MVAVPILCQICSVSKLFLVWSVFMFCEIKRNNHSCFWSCVYEADGFCLEDEPGSDRHCDFSLFTAAPEIARICHRYYIFRV